MNQVQHIEMIGDTSYTRLNRHEKRALTTVLCYHLVATIVIVLAYNI